MDTEVRTEDRTLRIGGLNAHVSEGGSGMPLLLVHGLGGPPTWRLIFEPLMRHFRVLSIDLPGFGGSDPPKRWYSNRDYADFLVQTAEELEFRDGIVCGVSWGGQLAVEFADRQPARVAALVLIASSGLRRRVYASAPAVARAVAGALRRTILQSPALIGLISRALYYEIDSRPPDSVALFAEQLSPDGRKEAFANALLAAAAGDPRMAEKLSRIRAPALILWGENDLVIPKKHAFRFQKAIPDATLRLFPRCGHAMPLEKPEELIDALLTFTRKELPCKPTR